MSELKEPDKVREILDTLLINNDKYIVDKIMEYTYNKCCICNTFFSEDGEVRYDDKDICYHCFLRLNWINCSRCKKYYDKLTNIYCIACISSCRVFCHNCLEESNRLQVSEEEREKRYIITG